MMFLNIVTDIDSISGIVVASLVVGVSYYLLSKKSIFSNFSKVGLIIYYLIIILFMYFISKVIMLFSLTKKLLILFVLLSIKIIYIY